MSDVIHDLSVLLAKIQSRRDIQIMDLSRRIQPSVAISAQAVRNCILHFTEGLKYLQRALDGKDPYASVYVQYLHHLELSSNERRRIAVLTTRYNEKKEKQD